MFQQRKHKRFTYIPRHLRDSEQGEELKTQWSILKGSGKRQGRSRSFVLLLVGLGMIIALWFILNHYEGS